MERAGRVNGMMFVLTGPEGVKSGMCGTYRIDPQQAIDDASDSMQTLYTYAVRKRMDPLTATNFI